MSYIVKIDDFKGFHNVAVNKNASSKFQSIIDYWENEYLTQLLGIELRNLFVADLLNGVPQNPEYLEFYNEFQIDLGCGQGVIFSKGMKQMILGLVYYHFISNDNARHTLTGTVVNDNANSSILDNLNTERVAEKRYNEIIDTYNIISYKVVRKLKLYDQLTRIETKFLDLI